MPTIITMTPAFSCISYGPHIFHTNSKEVFDYLSRFTAWRQYQHKVLASVDGQLVPIPINLDTINRLYGLNLNSFQMEDFLTSRAEKEGCSANLRRCGGKQSRAASCTKNSSAATPANSGDWTLPNWTPR